MSANKLLREVFEAGYKKAEAYTAKVLQEQSAEIAQLKAKLKHETSRKHINELQSHINDLCEKLETALTSLRKYENGI